MTPGTFMEKQCHLREFAVYLRTDRAMCDVQIVDARRFLLQVKEARATTTGIYLRSLEPQIGHLAEISENAVKGKP